MSKKIKILDKEENEVEFEDILLRQRLHGN